MRERNIFSLRIYLVEREESFLEVMSVEGSEDISIDKQIPIDKQGLCDI